MHFAPDSQGLLAPLAAIFEDSEVSEILINRPGEVYYEKNGELISREYPEFDHQMLDNLFRLIANENDQELSVRTPLLSGSLLDGSRVQLVLPPTAKYHTLSIRRKVVRDFALDDYKEKQFYQSARPFDIKAPSIASLSQDEQALIACYRTHDWDAFLRMAIEHKKNIVISGGTGSGKTTFLNACLKHIPHNERIITLEDAREIEIPHQNKVQLLATKGDQGLAKVSMQDLVQCCLRLRPDRIIMGEIRGQEVLDFVSACSTGHEGSITSVHANNPRIAFMRMTQMYKQNNVPSMSDEDIFRELNEVIDVMVQVIKTPTGRMATGIYYKYGDIKD